MNAAVEAGGMIKADNYKSEEKFFSSSAPICGCGRYYIQKDRNQSCKKLRNGSVYYAGQDKGLREKINEFILNNIKKDDPENDILRIDEIENNGSEKVAELRKALYRLNDMSGDLYLKLMNITNSREDKYNISGVNDFYENAELIIETKAKGKTVEKADISEKNENGFDTFLQTLVRKDDKGKTGLTSLMDQVMPKVFSNAPLSENPVKATKQRSRRLGDMNDASKVLGKADGLVEAVSAISKIIKHDMPEEIALLKSSVDQQKQKLRDAKIGMLDDVVGRMEHSKRWRSNSGEYQKMLDSANLLKIAAKEHSQEYKSATAERKQELDKNLKKALEDTGKFAKAYIDKKTGEKADKKFWTDKDLERAELAKSLATITKNLREEFYPSKAAETERQATLSSMHRDTTFSDKSKMYADEYYALKTHSSFKDCEDTLAKITALNMLRGLKDPTLDSSRLYSDTVVNFLSERVKKCCAFRELDFDKCTDYDKAEERYNKINGKIIASASEGLSIDARYMDSVKRDMFRLKKFKDELKECIVPSYTRKDPQKDDMKLK